ncbi:hypothetical protein AHAS_Ahas08G0135200 [Arachis hypogaea]
MCRKMKRMVPEIVEAAMRVYAEKKSVVEVLQAMQEIEAGDEEILLRLQAGCSGGDGECGGWRELSWFRRLADRRGVGHGGEAERDCWR